MQVDCTFSDEWGYNCAIQGATLPVLSESFRCTSWGETSPQVRKGGMYIVPRCHHFQKICSMALHHGGAPSATAAEAHRTAKQTCTPALCRFIDDDTIKVKCDRIGIFWEVYLFGDLMYSDKVRSLTIAGEEE